MFNAIVQSTLFLVFSLSLFAYVAMELNQFNDAISKELVYSYRFNVRAVNVDRTVAQSGVNSVR